MSNPLPKPIRLRVFLDRLAEALPAADAAAAKQLVDDTLNAVENELTDIPCDPSQWRTDGRMYPAQEDSASDVEGFPGVTSYRSRKHETLVRDNGAIEIRDAHSLEVMLSKPGRDGKGVWS
jgi:hypothetical protein